MWKPTAQTSMLNQQGLDELCHVQFKGFHGLDGTSLMQRMLLASHLYHRDWLLGCLNNPNSFIMNSSAIYRNDAVISYVNKSRPSLLLILGCLQSFTSVECLPMLLT